VVVDFMRASLVGSGKQSDPRRARINSA
jgi:hypothetical protein